MHPYDAVHWKLLPTEQLVRWRNEEWHEWRCAGYPVKAALEALDLLQLAMFLRDARRDRLSGRLAVYVIVHTDIRLSDVAEWRRKQTRRGRPVDDSFIHFVTALYVAAREEER
jgi:hypothetical protein